MVVWMNRGLWLLYSHTIVVGKIVENVPHDRGGNGRIVYHDGFQWNRIGEWEVEDTCSELWLMVALHVSIVECVNSTTGVWLVYLLVLYVD